MIEERLGPEAFLLDDGFQHWRLERALDIVVLDGLDPFGGGAAIPLGRLREAPRALARAGAIVVTRGAAGLEAEIRKYNRAAPVFRSRVTAEAWVDAATGERWSAGELPAARVGAFCGLGNPASFWRTLAGLGYRPLFRKAYADHHAYRMEELREMAARGVEALATTEKDVRNLPEDWREAVGPVRVLWLKIGVEVESGEELVELVKARVKAG